MALMRFSLTSREQEIISLLGKLPSSFELPPIPSGDELQNPKIIRDFVNKVLGTVSENELHNLGVSCSSLERIKAKTYGLRKSVFLSDSSYGMLAPAFDCFSDAGAREGPAQSLSLG